MIIEIVENDTPREVKDKLAEYIARPPQPVLRFYGKHSWSRNTFKFQVRNGMPIPLMYGIYVDSDGDYREATDHIGPFSTDWWRVTFDRKPSGVVIKLGLVPFEFQTDKLEVVTCLNFLLVQMRSLGDSLESLGLLYLQSSSHVRKKVFLEGIG